MGLNDTITGTGVGKSRVVWSKSGHMSEAAAQGSTWD